MLNDCTISRIHAAIRVGINSLKLSDDKSKFGTFIVLQNPNISLNLNDKLKNIKN